MRRSRPRRQHRQQQQGLSAGMLLALLVMLSSLIAFAVSSSSAQSTALARDIAAGRALQAAQAGLEWGRYRISVNATPTCAASSSLAIPFSSGAVLVTVTCQEALPAFNEAGTAVRIFQLSAVACGPSTAGSCPDAGGRGDYVEQRVSGLAQR